MYLQPWAAVKLTLPLLPAEGVSLTILHSCLHLSAGEYLFSHSADGGGDQQTGHLEILITANYTSH